MSTQLLIWLAISLVTGILSIRRPVIAVAAEICVFVFVPYVAGGLITGDDLVHPVTWMVLVTVGVRLIAQPRSIGTELAKRPLTYSALALSVGGALLSTYLVGHGSGISLLLNQMIAPVIFFVQIGALLTANLAVVYWLRNLLLSIGVIEVAIAGVSVASGGPLFYLAQYESKYWFANYGTTRALGTFDDPLTIALFLAACIPLLASVRKPWVQLALVSVFTSGIFLAQGRTALIVAVVGIVYLLLRRGASIAVRAAVVIGVAILIGLFLFSGLGDSLAARLSQDDGGSADARAIAWNLFFSIWQNFIFTGGGTSSSYNVAVTGGLGTSFESSVVMYTLDFGLVFSLIYFVTLSVIGFRAFTKGHLTGSGLALLGIVFTVQTFSSLGTNSAAGMMMWLFAGIAAARLGEPESPMMSTPGQTVAASEPAVGLRTNSPLSS